MSESRTAYANALMNTFDSPQLVLVSGDGPYVTAEDGTRYLDLLGGIAVNTLGYGHPAFVKAVSEQASRLAHVSNFFATMPQIALAQRLQGILTSEGYEGENARVFFTNSGTEANEAAFKLARMHKPGGRILAFTHSFHGRTMGALALTHKEAYRAPFEPLPGHVSFIEPAVPSLDAAMSNDVAALFLEPIQGEAGVVPIAPEVLVRARELCDEYGALLIIDEIQTGLGRTGRWLASAPYVHADVLTFAKALGGGFPIGACVGVGAAGALFQPGNHGTTFGGNPLAAAVALAVLGEIEGLLGHVADVGAWLAGELEQAGYHVRGAGLLLGIEVADAPAARDALLREGFIVNAPNPTTLRLAPPLIITREQLEPFVRAMAAHRFQEAA